MELGRRTIIVLVLLLVGGGAWWVWEARAEQEARQHQQFLRGFNTTLSAVEPLSSVTNRGKRSLTQPTGPPPPRCGARLVLNYTKESTTSFTFDLCAVIDCKGKNSSYRNKDVYLCDGEQLEECETTTRAAPIRSPCDSWSRVGWTTGEWDPPARLERTYINSLGANNWDLLTIQRDFSVAQNPITLSLNNVEESRMGHSVWMFVLGVYQGGDDQLTPLQINLLGSPLEINATVSPKDAKINRAPLTDKDVIIKDFSKMDPEDLLELTAGAGRDNVWMKWLIQNAKDQKMEGCVACAAARPTMFTNPAPLYPGLDPLGYECILNMTRFEVSSRDCTTLAALLPPGFEKPGYITAIKGEGARYHCFNFTGTKQKPINLGKIPADWCNATTHNAQTVVGPVARLGLFYYCGGLRIYAQIKHPDQTVGLCAMVRLAMPLSLVGKQVKFTSHKVVQLTVRRRRHVLKSPTPSFDPWANSPTYIDYIGVPRGVPNEYKLADQIAAGFENLPIISALFPITPSKNVDRINFVHYNVLRLSNATRDAIEGLAEQMAPTSLMALQNRMALDMLLAEKGGVCSMFGEMCCTVIPNNTAPDGKVTRALNQLRALSKEMHEASGVDNPLEGWMTNMFGKWKSLIMACLTSLAVFLAILVTCGCCCIPCLRTLFSRLITTALSKESPPPYSAGMLPLLTADDADEEDAHIVL